MRITASLRCTKQSLWPWDHWTCQCSLGWQKLTAEVWGQILDRGQTAQCQSSVCKRQECLNMDLYVLSGSLLMPPAPCKGEGSSQPPIEAFWKSSRHWGGHGGAPALSLSCGGSREEEQQDRPLAKSATPIDPLQQGGSLKAGCACTLCGMNGEEPEPSAYHLMSNPLQNPDTGIVLSLLR